MEPEQLDEFLTKIQKLQSIMIEVATGESRIDDEEEEYIELYREVALQIELLQEAGLAISNPNHFRSLWDWYDYWSSQLDRKYAARRKYIRDLYISVADPIEKSLHKQRVQATSSEDFIQDLKRRLNPQASAKAPAPISIQPHQTVDVLSQFTGSNSSWIDESVMNPEIFLEQKDVVPLNRALNQFAIKVNVASDRQDILEGAGVDIALLANLRLDTPPNRFAQALVAAFKNYRVSSQRLDYHPMVSLLQYLLAVPPYELADQDAALFTQLVERGEENCKALAAGSAVGRIESPKGQGIGTGVLIGKNLLLTCDHIFCKSQMKQAWVRFNYTSGSYALDSDVFELDLDAATRYSQLDYALVRVRGELKQRTANLIDAILDSNQEIRLIHHPQGRHVVVSGLGQIVQVGEDYIDHNISTDEGSSGAPIFNLDWQLVAIHRGNLGIGHAGRSLEPGTTSAVPLRAFWKNIPTQLS